MNDCCVAVKKRATPPLCVAGGNCSQGSPAAPKPDPKPDPEPVSLARRLRNEGKAMADYAVSLHPLTKLRRPRCPPTPLVLHFNPPTLHLCSLARHHRPLVRRPRRRCYHLWESVGKSSLLILLYVTISNYFHERRALTMSFLEPMVWSFP